MSLRAAGKQSPSYIDHYVLRVREDCFVEKNTLLAMT